MDILVGGRGLGQQSYFRILRRRRDERLSGLLVVHIALHIQCSKLRTHP